jgi:hypothetical protein
MLMELLTGKHRWNMESRASLLKEAIINTEITGHCWLCSGKLPFGRTIPTKSQKSKNPHKSKKIES